MPYRPNIILINCDDLGYGDLGCYGSTRNKTPHLDRLAAEGMRFTDFYQASSVCSPSRGAMLTGCYPPRIDFGDFDGKGVLFPGDPTGLNPNEQTIACLLKAAGYATAIVGKWHCGDQREFLPTRHGFDHYYGIPYSNDMGMQKCRPDCKVPLPLLKDEDVIQEQPDQCGLTERYVEKCVEFIRAHKQGPFFLYFAHMHVHLPLLVSQRFLAASSNGAYGAAVECIDWATGALMAELARLGIERNTVVIFTSDNGSRAGSEGGSNAPLRGTKASVWEGGFRVPAIFRWPGVIPAGAVQHTLMSAIDFLPTFCALANAPLPRLPIDGLDFSSVLLGQQQHGPRTTFFYYAMHRLAGVRHGAWKLKLGSGVWEKEEPAPQLYNLNTDVAEQHNVYHDHPDVVTQLESLMDACRADLGDDWRGIPGTQRRPKGRVAHPVTLTQFDPHHPYMIAEYDGPAG